VGNLTGLALEPVTSKLLLESSFETKEALELSSNCNKRFYAIFVKKVVFFQLTLPDLSSLLRLIFFTDVSPSVKSVDGRFFTSDDKAPFLAVDILDLRSLFNTPGGKYCDSCKSSLKSYKIANRYRLSIQASRTSYCKC